MVRDGCKYTELGPIPEDWDTAAFRDCFDTLPNNTLSRAELNDRGGTVKNIHYGDVLVRFPAVLDCRREELPYVNPEWAPRLSAAFLRDGDVVIADTAEDSTVGKAVEIAGTEGRRVVSGLHTIPCRPRRKELFAPKWLGYFMNHRAYHDQLLPFITGTKVSAISRSAIADTVIAIPGRAEQERVVEALSDVDGLIDGLERLIAKKRDVRRAAAGELLSGRLEPGGGDSAARYKIGETGVFYTGLTGKTKADFGHGEARYITFLNVLENEIVDMSILERVDVSRNESQNAVRPGDLFFNTSSETPEEVGMCAVLLDEADRVFLNSFCFGFRLEEPGIDPLFASYYFNGQEGRKIMRVLAQGATRFNLSKANFQEVEVAFPPYERQREIAGVLRCMDREIDALRAEVRKYRQIRSGMMDDLLTGRVRLR
ncbi:restriction endonuclease subunit S [uncultured Oscillibacter sp.]|uniref:restriction endonuclease subunit S n=1 Tax=uncultured Oscillibacter sp. TaxID=876091 RepID=UPI00260CAC11|nr:restriction endonuclease subunit S [uncultured Oscillibacter sp.]